MGTIASPRFYVYALCRPNGKPFYVGKGQGRRVFKHDTEARSGHKCHKCNVIRKIWKQGGQVQRYILLETDSEQEALDYEVSLIALFGRASLTNVTDGGTGVTGYRFSADVRARISAAGKGRVPTDEARANLRAALLGHRHSSDTLGKLRDAARRRLTTSEGRRHFDRMLAAAKAPTARVKLSAARKQLFSDPEFLAQHRAARRVLSSDQVAEVRHLYTSGRSQQSIAQQFGIAQSTVGRIVRRETYSDDA